MALMKFDPTFSLGQVCVLSGVLLTGGGMIFTFEKAINSAITEVNKAVTKAETENMLQNQRLDALDRVMTDAKRADDQFRIEIRQALTAISGDVQKVSGDVRELNAMAKQRR